MDYLTEDKLQLFLNKEWLIKINSNESKPYLLKFHSSTVELSCCILITDTINVWGEVLHSRQFFRRWRVCNPSRPGPFTNEDEEEESRSQMLRILGDAHSLGGFEDLSFEVVPSRNADLAFELGSEEFKWRWETYLQGPKMSADILSKQLILPLISVTHLAFSSADPVNEMSEADLEKAVDKIGRTGRRSLDTHVKHAISRPRLTTTLRRMSAMFNFLPDLPPIISRADAPDLHIPAIRANYPALSFQADAERSSRPASVTEMHSEALVQAQNIQTKYASRPNSEDSVTEDEDEDKNVPPVYLSQNKGKVKANPLLSSPIPAINPPTKRGSTAARSRQLSLEPEPIPDKTVPAQGVSSASDSSPLRPVKKSKRAQISSSSDDDSEAERRRRLARLKSGSSRGAKQPIKRGGKRF